MKRGWTVEVESYTILGNAMLISAVNGIAKKRTKRSLISVVETD